MKHQTRQIAVCAMLCALFGVLCLINLQSASLIVDLVPFLFALPALVAASMYTAGIGWTACAAMIVLAFLFSEPVGWIAVVPYVIAGTIAGSGLRLHFNRFLTILVITLLLGLAAVMQFTVFAKLFGYNISEMAAEYAMFAGFISPVTLLVLVSFLTGFLEGALLVMLAFLMAKRLPKLLPTPTDFVFGGVSVWCAWAFVLTTLLFVAGHTVLKYPIEMRDLVTICEILLYCLMVYEVWFLAGQKGKFSDMTRGRRFLFTLFLWIFPLNLPFALYGTWYLLRASGRNSVSQ